MRFRNHHFTYISSLLIATSALAGDTTSWQVMQGDWATPSNWTAGEPTAGSTAVIENNGVAFVSTLGETCSQLIVGQTGAGSLSIFSGNLTVGTSILVGNGADGFVTQASGSVLAPSLDVRAGGYGVSGGTLDIVTGSVGDVLGGGALIVSGPSTFTVTDNLTVLGGALLSFQGGTITCGTTAGDDLLAQGEIAVTFTPTVSLQNLTFDGIVAGLTFNVSELGHATIDVTGTLTLAGRLTITDSNAPAGRHDLVTAAVVTGAFDEIILPTGWTSGVDGTTLWVEKTGLPVEATSWSELKNEF